MEVKIEAYLRKAQRGYRPNGNVFCSNLFSNQRKKGYFTSSCRRFTHPCKACRTSNHLETPL